MGVLRGFLFENLGVKLVALLLALVVYLHVYTERQASMSLAFPVELTDLSDSLTITHLTPMVVTAELRGTGKQLIRLRLIEPRLKVSLKGVGPGRFQRALTVDDLPLARTSQIEVERFTGPQVVEMEIDRVIVRMVPVAARIEGDLAGGARWPGAWSAEPARVSLRGPRHSVLVRDSLALRPVRLDGRRDTMQVAVGLDSLPEGCEANPTAVTLRVPLVRRPPVTPAKRGQ